jgi:putative pyruvate formate lyase activating enzyme
MQPELSYQPNYISLFNEGLLQERAKLLMTRLEACDICPRKCGVNRVEGKMGFCHSGYLPVVSSICDHHGEEPVLSGINGSGAIFFGNCNMRCVYCQNHQISQNWEIQKSNEISIQKLASNMIYLQEKLQCHNINFVSPTHFVPQIVMAIAEAIPMGLRIPLVYNTNAYDSPEIIKLLNGIVDIYLPDLRYAADIWARKYSRAPEYVFYSRTVIKEMHRQVGELVIDKDGIARRGLIVRHLVLPHDIAGSEPSLRWLASELSNSVTISIMAQYNPVHLAKRVPLLSRPITKKEFDDVVFLVDELGLENGWVQEMESVNYYLPDFNRNLHPFE